MLLFASIVLAEHPNNSDIYRSPMTLAATLFIVFPLRLSHNAALKTSQGIPNQKWIKSLLTLCVHHSCHFTASQKPSPQISGKQRVTSI